MGNCCQRQSCMQLEGKELNMEGNNMLVQDYNNAKRMEKVVVKDLDKTAISVAAEGREVKIKITKKQLEELLSRVEVKELSIRQVLVQLMDASTSKFDCRHHHINHQGWKPALQSIPE